MEHGWMAGSSIACALAAACMLGQLVGGCTGLSCKGKRLELAILEQPRASLMCTAMKWRAAYFEAVQQSTWKLELQKARLRLI